MLNKLACWLGMHDWEILGVHSWGSLGRFCTFDVKCKYCGKEDIAE